MKRCGVTGVERRPLEDKIQLTKSVGVINMDGFLRTIQCGWRNCAMTSKNIRLKIFIKGVCLLLPTSFIACNQENTSSMPVTVSEDIDLRKNRSNGSVHAWSNGFLDMLLPHSYSISESGLSEANYLVIFDNNDIAGSVVGPFSEKSQLHIPYRDLESLISLIRRYNAQGGVDNNSILKILEKLNFPESIFPIRTSYARGFYLENMKSRRGDAYLYGPDESLLIVRFENLKVGMASDKKRQIMLASLNWITDLPEIQAEEAQENPPSGNASVIKNRRIIINNSDK